ncbi:MAG TPA: carboxypeptidase regulatory-like domain-containing protein [Candidatus Lustribacter sp.]|nr:carboxypeptidase regulatory-like domain-containing protein [Candidatus Lustribacter sp.]
MRSAFALGFIAVALAACGPGGLDLTREYATVTGRVVDTDTLQPIAGAIISIGNIVSVTAAIDQGGFVMRNVPAGSRTLTITAVGWKSYRAQVETTANQTLDIGTIGLPSSLSR